jgi:hypothetical protein
MPDSYLLSPTSFFPLQIPPKLTHRTTSDRSRDFFYTFLFPKPFLNP